MKLGQHHTIERDPCCFILKYREDKGINKKTGKPIIASKNTYHASIMQAIETYVSDVANVDGEIKDLIESLEQVKQTIKSISK
jgi:hypothetical protein